MGKKSEYLSFSAPDERMSGITSKNTAIQLMGHGPKPQEARSTSQSFTIPNPWNYWIEGEGEKMTEDVVLKDTLNTHWKENKNGFGYKMLMKMGWSESKGLGKNEDGIVNSVKIKKRNENVGLGMEGVVDDQVGSKSWNQTVSGFTAVLDLLKNSNYGQNGRNDNSDSDGGDKPKKKKSKKEKKEKKEKKPKPIIQVGIKYKKFRDAKTLAGRTAEEKKAIFGHVVSSSTPTSTVTSSPAPVVKSESTSSFSELESKDKKSKKEKKDKKEKKRKRSDGDD